MEELDQQGKTPRALINERFDNLLRKIENDTDFLLNFDLMKLRRHNVDWNLWYFAVWMTGGSVEDVVSIRPPLELSNSEAKQRLNALDLILAVLRKRLAQLAETARAQKNLTQEIPNWYLKTLKTLRLSQNQLINFWYDELNKERKAMKEILSPQNHAQQERLKIDKLRQRFADKHLFKTIKV